MLAAALSPTDVQGTVLAWIGVVGVVIGALSPVLFKLLEQAKSLRAAWTSIDTIKANVQTVTATVDHHDKQLNGEMTARIDTRIVKNENDNLLSAAAGPAGAGNSGVQGQPGPSPQSPGNPGAEKGMT